MAQIVGITSFTVSPESCKLEYNLSEEACGLWWYEGLGALGIYPHAFQFPTETASTVAVFAHRQAGFGIYNMCLIPLDK